jgi:arylsulfatase A-like enzyme
MRQYGAAISAMDAQMGRLQKRLKELGIEENTMLWFTSDNGPEHNTPGETGGLREQKRSLHEGGIRVPGLLYFPALGGSKIIQTPVSTCDYFPTILDLLNIPLPNRPLDGVSILPLLQEKKFTRPTPLYFVSKGQEAAISGDYKYYRKNPTTPPELYNLKEDPCENNNLATLFPERLAAFQKGFSIWLQSCKESFEGKEYGTKSYNLLHQKWPIKTSSSP